MNKSVYILNVEAKDIYISNHLKSDIGKNNIIGYNSKCKDGNYNLRKYNNAFDYSLDLIKLREINYKVYRNRRFSFFNDKGKEFSNKIINVNFTYSNKEYNNYGTNLYVMSGYLPSEIDIKDNICIINDTIIGIITNQTVNNPVNINSLYFYYDEENNVYARNEKKKIKTLNSVKNIRENLYSNGFYCNGNHYVRFKRSSGSSRVGKCLFIDEKLYKPMHKYDMCGLKIKYNQDIDLAAFESYISLSSSSIIDTIVINKENILVVDDYESVFKDDVIDVSIENGGLLAVEKKSTITNSIWDGQSLIDKSLMGDYRNKGMLLLRNRFFKTCAFNCNIQQFFSDNNIFDISQLNGQTFAKSISDIKLITTPNSIKYLKFGSLNQWLDNIDNVFGIVKYEKKPPFFNGYLAQSHYQLLNTLQLSYEDVERFLQPTFDFIDKMKSDPAVLKYYIKLPKVDVNSTIDSINDVVFKLLGCNKNFHKTKLYHDFRNKVIKAFIKNLRNGHVLINGNYSTMCGNPIEMLYFSINKFNGMNILSKGTVYTTRFEFNKEILASRSPHILAGNVWIVNNKNDKLIEKYMNPTQEIIYINTIGENIQERLNGCDFDSDAVLITDELMLINSAKKNYHKFKVPTSFVKANKINRKYTASQQADLDIRTSVNKIGEIVNLSQELNSLMWHNLNNDPDWNYMPLYLDICKLAVMSCIEIDKAKKEYELNSISIMNELREKYTVKNNVSEYRKRVKPYFLKNVTENNGYTVSKDVMYEYYDTTMDYLQKSINKYVRNTSKIKTVPLDLLSIINKKYNYKNVWTRQIDSIMKYFYEAYKEICSIWSGEGTYKTKIECVNDVKKNLVSAISCFDLNDDTKICLLNNKLNNRLVFETLFLVDGFYELFIDIEGYEYISLDNDGEFIMYGLNFTKMTILGV